MKMYMHILCWLVLRHKGALCNSWHTCPRMMTISIVSDEAHVSAPFCFISTSISRSQPASYTKFDQNDVATLVATCFRFLTEPPTNLTKATAATTNHPTGRGESSVDNSAVDRGGAIVSSKLLEFLSVFLFLFFSVLTFSVAWPIFVAAVAPTASYRTSICQQATVDNCCFRCSGSSCCHRVGSRR
jgi:hypothetical protein